MISVNEELQLPGRRGDGQGSRFICGRRRMRWGWVMVRLDAAKEVGRICHWCSRQLLADLCSGVGRILLIDVRVFEFGHLLGNQLTIQFDLTTLSSLNRHACATLEDVGSPKVIAMQKFFKKVAPWAQYVFSRSFYPDRPSGCS